AISMITVMAIVIFTIYGKGFLSVVAILLGIVTGYIAAIIIGKVTGQSIVDFSNVSQASWLSLPTMEIPFLSYKW
ncbi:hypothetical protein JVW24_24695, partial [Vibrio cholerae O1]|nr:hypothetical protein [Vibrio cholerae O1]